MIDFEQKGIFSRLAKEDNSIYLSQISPMLVNGEEIVWTFQGFRDGVVFTNKRIISINIQGITGKKKDYSSLPYNKIQSFSVETAGTLDLDTELVLWFSGLGKVKFEFVKNCNISEIAKFISEKVL